MKKPDWKYLLVLFCGWLAIPAYCQFAGGLPVPLDTLVKQVEKAVFEQPNKAMELGQACIERSNEEKNGNAAARCGLAVANACYHLGRPWEAKEYIGAAIRQAVGDRELYFRALLLQHSILCATGEPPLAWQSLQKARQLSETYDLPPNLQASLYQEMGHFIIYFNWLEKKQGKEFLEKALKIYASENDKKGMALVLGRLGKIADTPDEALGYFQKALAVFEEKNDLVNVGWTHFDLGLAYRNKKDFARSLAHFNKALAIHRKNDLMGGVADIMLEIGNLYLLQGQPEAAVLPLKEALALAVQIPLLPNISDASGALAKAYEQMGDLARAYPFLQKNLQYKDSTFYEKMSKHIAESNARYQSEQRKRELAQKELELARQKNERNFILLGSTFALILMAGFSLWRFFHQKQKKRAAELALQLELRESEKLRELDLAKTRFFTNISHELRTPLTLIISPLEEALKKLKQVSLEPGLRLALRNSQQLLKLINEILDLAKLESGKVQTRHSETELVPLLHRIFSAFKPAADMKGIAFSFDAQLPGELAVQLDAEKLETILNNLISNALKFTPKGGSVKLEAGQLMPGPDNSANLEIAVSDTGPGIRPDDLPHIFDRFFQGKKNSGTSIGGTGIGLALAKQLSTLLGGNLTAESQPGKGCRFVLQLPLVLSGTQNCQPYTPALAERATVNKQTPTSIPQPPPEILCGSRPRLLIVEDNEEMSGYLKSTLSKHYDCSVAVDGQQALSLLSAPPADGPGGKQKPFDFIISDVMMPNMDGFTFREKINKRPEWRRIPFILLTARTLEADKLKGFQLGIDDYITKPFSLPELEARIRNLLVNKQLRDGMNEGVDKKGGLAHEEQLLRDAEKLVLEKMKDPEFSVGAMAKSLGYSQRHLSRVFGKLAGLTPVQFVLELRLQRARQLLEGRNAASVAEVRYEIGIESASYFTRKFTERFGKKPKDTLEQVG